MTIIVSTNTTGRSAHAGGRGGCGDGGNVHPADNVIDGVIGNGVMTAMREVGGCSERCAGAFAFVGWSHYYDLCIYLFFICLSCALFVHFSVNISSVVPMGWPKWRGTQRSTCSVCVHRIDQ